jgi:hypothetical protein
MHLTYRRTLGASRLDDTNRKTASNRLRQDATAVVVGADVADFHLGH